MSKGLAKEWATTQFRQMELNPQHFASWEVFLVEMKHVFEDPNKKHNAQHHLCAFKQWDNQTADKFFMHFNNLKIDAGFNDEALLDLLHVNIRPDLLEHAICNSTMVEDTLASWETALHHYDHHQHDLDLDCGDHVNHGHFGDFGGQHDGCTGGWNDRRGGGMGSATVGGGIGGWNDRRGGGMGSATVGGSTGVTAGTSGHDGSGHNVSSGGGQVFEGQGQPMDLDRSRGHAFPHQCFNCKATTHLAKNCPTCAIRSAWE
ncbi:hypothetical protein APHAL10511_003515 [Amanita phalloides]|nr:hypothetical protein APHAL10511_003515 [Amanita phalloides]